MANGTCKAAVLVLAGLSGLAGGCNSRGHLAGAGEDPSSKPQSLTTGDRYAALAYTRPGDEVREVGGFAVWTRTGPRDGALTRREPSPGGAVTSLPLNEP